MCWLCANGCVCFCVCAEAPQAHVIPVAVPSPRISRSQKAAATRAVVVADPVSKQEPNKDKQDEKKEEGKSVGWQAGLCMCSVCAVRVLCAYCHVMLCVAECEGEEHEDNKRNSGDGMSETTVSDRLSMSSEPDPPSSPPPAKL